MAEAKLSEETWREIQGLYETGHVSVSSLSRQYGVSRTLIHRRAKHWVHPMSAAIREASTEEVEQAIDSGARRKVLLVRGGDAASSLEDAVDERASVITRHRRDWVELEVLKRAALRSLHDPEWRPTGWTEERAPDASERADEAARLFKTMKLGVEALLGAQEGERRAHGFSFQMQQKQEQAGGEMVERRQQLIEQIKAAMEPKQVEGGQ